MISAERNHFEIAEALIQAGADVNAVDQHRTPALIWAVVYRNIEIVRLLIQSKANIDAQEINGETPLHHAVRNHSEPIIKLLVKHSTSLNIQNVEGEPPLLSAGGRGSITVAKLLVEAGADPFVKDNNGRSAFDIEIVSSYYERQKLMESLFDSSKETESHELGIGL